MTSSSSFLVRRFRLVFPSALALLSTASAVVACGSEGNGVGAAADGGADGGFLTSDAAGLDGAPDGTTASGSVTLPFTPSNVADPVDFAGLTGDLVYTGSNCGNFVNFDPGKTGCADPGTTYRSFETIQKDGSKVRVFVARNIRIEAATEVRVMGTLPVVFLALENVDIVGTLQAAADKGRAVGGGYGSPSTAADGLGPGGGTWSADLEGAGASYCGKGGASGGGNAGGALYGNPELLPLYGGSSGGGQFSGAGGGAIQIVAGKAIRVTATGVVHVGGGGGDGSGGGSGGAILLEAPEVTIDGVLAANGGGGAAGTGASDGDNGKPSATPAAGGPSTETPAVAGGAGSAGARAEGLPGERDPRPNFAFHGSGGGGAGRIRVNTSAGKTAFAGTFSPAATTGCATFGVVGVNVRSDAGAGVNPVSDAASAVDARADGPALEDAAVPADANASD
ncbi:MAG: hypothetical protein U0169_15235 [Polyangiaceae bacterium]